MFKKIFERILLSLKTRLIDYNNIPSLLTKTKIPYSHSLFHSSAFSYGNAGDLLLPIVLRDLFDISLNKIKWKGNHVHKPLDHKDLSSINIVDALVIGGGGLFLSDTNPNSLSGWQWPCSIEQLREIEKPIILFAVGYNRFRDQDDFSDIFRIHIVETIRKAAFVGLRNNGSIESIKKYLPEELHTKLIFQPCMTTVISRIYPNLVEYKKKEGFIAVNCAFDRSELRLGSKNQEIRRSITLVLKELSKNYEIRYYSHMKNDMEITKEFDELELKYKVVNLQFCNAHEIIQHYSTPKLVIGMRGHAQMIPFGCLTPILSIVSHNKLQWFLDDINHSEWGCDVLSDDFQKELLESAKDSLQNTENRINEIDIEQKKLWEITQANMKKIKTEISI